MHGDDVTPTSRRDLLDMGTEHMHGELNWSYRTGARYDRCAFHVYRIQIWHRGKQVSPSILNDRRQKSQCHKYKAICNEQVYTTFPSPGTPRFSKGALVPSEKKIYTPLDCRLPEAVASSHRISIEAC